MTDAPSSREPSLLAAATVAAEAVTARGRKIRRTIVAATAFVIVTVLATVSLTVGIAVNETKVVHQLQTQATDRAARFRALLKANGALSAQNQHLICLAAESQRVELAGLRTLAQQFGVRIPRLPGETLDCPNGTDDVLIGTAGPDVLRGTARADFMSGLAGADRILGHLGNDTEIAGAGRDRLRGGQGNDTLRAVEDDGVRDVLNGGAGHDTCYLQPGDVAHDCEVVHRQGGAT